MERPLHAQNPIAPLPLYYRRVRPARPLVWLSRAIEDMRTHLVASLLYGLVFAVIGYLILAFAARRPFLFSAAVSGFMLIAPLAAAGLYEISRKHGKGEACGFIDSLRGLASHGPALLQFGAFLLVAILSWERISSGLFNLLRPANSTELPASYREIFLTEDYSAFVLAYLGIGGVLAALLFCLTALSLPLMMDRGADLATAMTASLKAVRHNPGAMGFWAALLVVLIAIGMATWMVGLVITLPLAGHASWHAYRELISPGRRNQR